jgi:uncharacterized protein
MPRILIDADGCPVVDICIAAAARHGCECFILCDTSHYFKREGAVTMTFDKGADSVDFALVNLIKTGDIVITQDYGLAAMCLAKHAITLNQDGMEYTPQNIDGLLERRYTNKRLLRAGKHPKGQPPRTQQQNEAFKMALEKALFTSKIPSVSK